MHDSSLFFNCGFEFQDYIYNVCHDLTMLSINVSNIPIITVKNVDYLRVLHNFSKYKAIDLLKGAVL